MDKTIQELTDAREDVGVIKGKIFALRAWHIKDDIASGYMRRAEIHLSNAIEVIVLAIDAVKHSVIYETDKKDNEDG